MSEALHVYVPTRGRIHQQHTMRHFHLRDQYKEGRVHPVFVVPRCERVEFKRAHSWAPVLTVPDEWRIGDISQYILYDCGGRFKVISDDDFRLIRRRDPDSVSQRGGSGNAQDARDLFDRVAHWLCEGYVHGGVSLRQTNHYHSARWKENTRVSGFMFFDCDVVTAEGVRFDEVQERQDFHITLSLLELGYPNICDFEFIVGQAVGGTNAPGGCSTYRTPEFLKEQAKRLKELHPGSVTLVMKHRVGVNTKAMSGDEGIPDVRVNWAGSLGLRADDRKVGGEVACSG